MLNHPFNVHKNNKFKRLIEVLQNQGVIVLKSCSNTGKKIKIKNNHILAELIYFSFLVHSGHLMETKEKRLVISSGKGINIYMYPYSSEKILTELITIKEETFLQKPEQLFNAFLAVYIASNFCFDFIYPNTYIVELGKRTHELDIFGCVINKSKPKYLLIETTLGFFKKEGNEKEITSINKDSHNWHFKKAIMKKWALEKIFDKKIGLVYISIRSLDTLTKEEREDKFVKTIIEKDHTISTVFFLPQENPSVRIHIFSKGNMANYKYIKHNFLKKLIKEIKKILRNL